MDPIWVLGPIFGAIFGGLYGFIMKERSFTGNTGWIYLYIVLGTFWGLSAAAMHASNNKDKYKGEFLTEVNEKNRKKELRKQKTEMWRAKRDARKKEQ